VPAWLTDDKGDQGETNMEIDAGLWLLLVCIIGFITLGCKMTTPEMALRDLGSAARKPMAENH
jgi:hypothetical protein